MKKVKLCMLFLSIMAFTAQAFCEKTHSSVQTARKVIVGTVVDEKGEGMVGASIIIKGTTKGCVTDIDGKYSLEAPLGTHTLVCSYIGFNTQERRVTIGDADSITVNFTLTEPALLQEVVVEQSLRQRQKNHRTKA